jgi:hypothetical protein
VQATGDILLGWLHADGADGHEGDYYVRQLRDWKGSADVESMNPTVLADYGQSCGEVLARAHARTGDRIAIAAYLGKGDAADRALTRFAEMYARPERTRLPSAARGRRQRSRDGRMRPLKRPAIIPRPDRNCGDDQLSMNTTFLSMACRPIRS